MEICLRLLAAVLASLLIGCSTPASPIVSPTGTVASRPWPCEAMSLLDDAAARLAEARSRLAASDGVRAKTLAQSAYGSSSDVFGTIPQAPDPVAALGEVRFKIIAASLATSQTADVLMLGTLVPTLDDLPAFDQGLVGVRNSVADAHQAVARATTAGFLSCSP